MARMNTQQKNYMKAKAIVDALKAQAETIEQEYIRSHNIINSNGETPKAIFCIDNEEVFNQANEATAPALDALEIYKAEKILREAEDDLIRYGLSIAPAKEREVLSNRCFGLNGQTILLNIRKSVIDLAFRLDVSTVK